MIRDWALDSSSSRQNAAGGFRHTEAIYKEFIDAARCRTRAIMRGISAGAGVHRRAPRLFRPANLRRARRAAYRAGDTKRQASMVIKARRPLS